jgi:hypothetical protein
LATARKAEAMANAAPGDSRYLALTTYRRDGRPVTTPVWFVALDGKIYVREGQAGARHGSGARCAVQHERTPHPGRVAGRHWGCRS